ncbi:MAG: galactokinase, partial [Clostridia bacterium]|nr:galactokinase [Clostridia bacterium]
MKKTELIKKINGGELDARLVELYDDRAEQRKRDILNGIEKFCKMYGEDREILVYSVPGRTELSGNHTDHNHGKVIASSIDLDIIAVVSPRKDNKVNLQSEGFRENSIDLDTFTKPDEKYVGHSEALIAGVADAFRKNGRKVCGFDAYTTSDVLRGSGMSSSAAFEVMIGNIFSNLCNDGTVDAIEIAKDSQYAENVFFGKPCGLMDQLACAVGGIISVDFKDEKEPVVEKVDFDLSEYGYRLCMVDTGGSHDDLTEDYASVPAEMKAVAAYFDKNTLREVSEDEFSAQAAKLRRAVGDRAVLRAFHFF